MNANGRVVDDRETLASLVGRVEALARQAAAAEERAVAAERERERLEGHLRTDRTLNDLLMAGLEEKKGEHLAEIERLKAR